MLGYLAKNSRFDAEVPGPSLKSFRKNYETNAGKGVVVNDNDIITLGDVNKWGPELRIYFPEPSFDLEFGPTVDIRPCPQPRQKRINNNKLWMILIRIGFRLGAKHDINTIEKNIPSEKGKFFREGLEL